MENTNNNPTTLYYYCSLETFFSIIEKNSIWLTEVSKSNDSLEQRYFPRVFISNIDKYLVKCLKIDPKDTNFIKLCKSIRAYLRVWSEDLQPDPVWAMCLSTKQDDLSQWRGYGDDAKGISIGFNFEYLNKINEAIKDTQYVSGYDIALNDYLYLKEISYGKEKINEYLDLLSQDKSISSLNLDKSEDIYKLLDFLKECIIELINRPLFKHPAFEAESEWRIIFAKIAPARDYTFNFSKLNSLNIFRQYFQLKDRIFEVRRNAIQSHIELGFTDIMSAIDNIYIGSKTHTTIKDIQMFLINKFGKDAVTSKGPNFILNTSASSYK